ncbi:MAG: vWA domain-containing protein [Bacteroidales bacterium]
MGFLHPWFLLLGLGITVPIIIHLFNFHRFKQVLFTNVKFLHSITALNKRKYKLLELLLLLLRCLAILFLALLFAQPYIKDSQNQLVKQGNNAVVLILDNSFSMQNIAKKGTLLETAKIKIEEIIDEYSDNDLFCLLTMDMEGQHKHFVTKKTLRNFLKNVEISPSSLPYSELINTAHRLLNLRNENNKLTFIISDFQIKSFDIQNIKQDSIIKDIFLPLEVNNINNIYVDSVIIDKNIFLKGQKINLTVRIKNSSNEDIEKQTVKLFINNKQQSLATYDIKANSYVDLPMSFVLENAGEINGRVSILDNPITYDDDFYFTINIGEKIKILSINGNGENKYLIHLFKNSSEIELNNMNASGIDFSKFAEYSTIILNELNTIPSGLANELKNCRKKKTSLVIIPSEHIDIASYNSAMLSLQMPLWDKEIKQTRKINIIDINNNIFKNVFSQVTDNMEMPQCQKYYKLKNSSNISRQDIMTMVNQDAFLTQNTINSSNAFVFTTPFNEQWSDFVNQSIFVPIMWNIALYSTVLPPVFMFSNEQSLFDISVLTTDNSAEYITLTKQGTLNSVIPQMQFINGRYGFYLQNQIKQAGFYDIKAKEKHLGVLALNYPREESELSFMKSNNIEKELKKISYKNYSVFNNKKMIKTYFIKSKKGFDFTFLLLILIILCLVLESCIMKKLMR